MRPLHALLVASTVWLGAAGCARGPFVCPARGGAAWRELQSRHFVLRTDLPRSQARAALADFERSYDAFASLVFPSTRPDTPHPRVDFVLFRSEEDFRALAPESATGYFLTQQNNDVEHTPAIAMHGGLREVVDRRFQHELTHRFLAHRVREAPPWLEEGLAEYYSTLRLVPGEAIVGDLPVRRVFRTELYTSAALHERWVEQRVAIADVPTLRALLDADYDTFHRPEVEVAHYAAAWALVHMLSNERLGYRARFHAFVDGLAAGASSADAWAESFGGLPRDQIERDYRRYVQRLEMDSVRVPWTTADRGRVESERRLDDGEVHLLWARTRPWDSRENIIRAEVDLEEAVTTSPRSAEAHYWMALYDERRRRFHHAEVELQRALELRPGDQRFLLALAELLWDEDSARPDGERSLERVDAVVAKLTPVARTPHALNFIARYYGERGQLDAGLPFARRAVEMGPGCWECQDTWALLRNAKGLGARLPSPRQAAPVLGRSID
jgi:tetratricopeptide (TPR) repeat protein